MLETVNLDAPKVEKEESKARFKAAIDKLVVLQQRARSEKMGVVVLFEGWKGAGKGSRISDIIYHLDARATSVHVTEEMSQQEIDQVMSDDFSATGFYPFLQQFWKALGSRGDMTFYDRGWYSIVAQYLCEHPHFKHLFKSSGSDPEATAEINRTTQHALNSIQSFESQLQANGYLVVKFFLHFSKESQRKRLEDLRDDEATRWRVNDRDMKLLDDYDEMYDLYDRLLRNSNFGSCEWVLLNAEDKRTVNMTVVETLVQVMEGELNRRALAKSIIPELDLVKPMPEGFDDLPYDERKRTDEQNKIIMDHAEEQARLAASLAPRVSRFRIETDYPRPESFRHDLVLDRETYKKELKEQQKLLGELEVQMYLKRVPLIIMYEGWDAAGKGGNIKRVAQALDARAYTIYPSPAPTALELAHPHLWRYWTRLPKAGHVGIYDRSWYGRVLVERVEGLATPMEWGRAYDEINEFERDLVGWGAILIKFWVDISRETQLERFEAREQNPDKVWKMTDEDWRNRDKYPQYMAAIKDMFRFTSTTFAPWTILESDDKLYARVKALKVINKALQERLG